MDRDAAAAANDTVTLDMVRQFLIREEDTIVFSLIERSKYPLNSPAYAPSKSPRGNGHGYPSLAELFIKGSEALQSSFGRYKNPEETPFFPENLPPSMVPPYNFSMFLHPPASSVNVSKTIYDIYFQKLLPSFVSNGDDGNYAIAVGHDLACLQAIARRIHYGKYVAEVKFRDAPDDYEPAIRSKDTDTLMTLLTDSRVEDMVKQRVTKKATVFGQEVTLNDTNSSETNFKVDPAVVSRLYDEWVIPLTKDVEVEYLLRRLD